jgi:hypothetical protein
LEGDIFFFFFEKKDMLLDKMVVRYCRVPKGVPFTLCLDRGN